MANKDAAPPATNAPVTIIIKRRKKGGHEAHHGGAWKVAYADFVTAMMAFFLLLWLLNATTEEQKKGISDYFTPATASRSKSGSGAILGGMTAGAPGALVSRATAPSITVDLRPSSDSESTGEMDTGKKDDAEFKDASPDKREEQLAKQEEAAFQKAEKELKEALNEIPELKGLEKNLVIDNTPEGLRIQLVDEEGQPMFASGSAKPLERTSKLLGQVARVIQALPNKLTISGHTDAVQFRGGSRSYGNWELSADRAGASRRVLVENGFQPERVGMVVGRAESDPLVPDDAKSPRNRRISIVLQREHPLPPKPGETAEAKPAPSPAKPAPAAAAPAKPATPEPRKFDRDWTGPRLR